MPPVSDVASLIPAALAALFGYALTAKVRDWPSTVVWLEAIRIPRPREVAVAGVASEGLLILQLVVVPRFGAAATVGWLAVATVLLVRSRHANVECGCLGLATDARRSRRPIARNLALIGLATTVWLLPGLAFPAAQHLAAIALLGPAVALLAAMRETWTSSPT